MPQFGRTGNREMEMIEERIAELSVSRLGFSVRKVNRLMEWRGFDVYYVEYDMEERPCVGPPIYYLVKGDKIIVASTEEAFEILRLLSPEDDEGEGDFVQRFLAVPSS